MTPNIEIDWLRKWSKYSNAAVALQSGEDGRALTYGELFNQSLRLADVLRSRFGIQRGDRVACVAQNELEYVALFFAVQRLGAILVPINFRFTAVEVEHIVRDSEAVLVIAQIEFWANVQGLGAFTTLWNFDGAESLVDAARVGEATDRGCHADFEDTCMILYTSGTTGFPKGAMISHRMIFWNSINTGLRLNLTEADVVVTFLPLFHTGGWNVLTTPCLHRGAKVILLRKFDADLVLRLSAAEKVSVLFGVPTTMDFLRRSALFATANLASIRYAIVGGEPMPLDLIHVWQKRGVAIRQGYGLTEFGPNVFSLSEHDSERKAGSIGFPNFYIQARVVDKDGREVPDNDVGELVLNGPMAMTGYWRNEEATRQVWRDGWMRTGDLVRRDEDGYFFVVGRQKEMFISGGENVYPAEIEKVLRLFQGVREAAVIGVRHERWGEVGRAFIAFENGVQGSTDDLREHCLRRLAKFKVPAEFVVLPELPKTESGKIAKKRLASEAPYS